mgnify:CR=1 FL=1
MVHLLKLKEYAEQTNDPQSLNLINNYIKTTSESWTKGKYYLGGQLQLELTEDITDEKIKFVEDKNNAAVGPCNSWESMSMNRSFGEISIIKNLIERRRNIIRMNGLLRAIVFWLSPARKRATEKVFHPSNVIKYFNEEEINFNTYMSYRNDMLNDADLGIV